MCHDFRATLTRMCAVSLVVASAGCGGSARQPSVVVTPERATFDVPVTIAARGLPSDTRATVTFSGTSSSGRTLTGTVASRTDSHGGLMLRDEFPYARMQVPVADFGPWPQRVKVAVRAGTTTAVAYATRLSLAHVHITVLDERPAHTGFFGEWYVRPRERNRTAILFFGGSEGGLSGEFLAETLAAHGYPVLELAYFAEPGLPATLTNIPLEYFERALVWMAKQPQVNAKKIVAWGASRGGEASMLLASTFPALVHGAVGYVPSAYVIPSPSDADKAAWTYRGRPLPAYSVIPVWKSSGPIFVVGGYDDQLWQSGLYVSTIRDEMRAHHRPDVTALTYENAGHKLASAIPPQFEFRTAEYGVVQSRYGTLELGGSPKADEAALEDSWPRVLQFLARI